MPNVLAHIGAQGALSRGLSGSLDGRWILLGCLLPDLPWIAVRGTRIFHLSLDPYDLRLFAIVQSSLLVTLVLCAALALVSAAPRRIFLLLSINTLLHLLLDASETKLANGVHLLAPWTWELTSWRLYWPESVPSLLLTVAGIGVLVWIWKKPGARIGLVLRGPQVATSAVLLLLYLLLPLLLMRQVESADNHFVRTLRQRSERVGRAVELDRVLYEDGRVGTFAFENLAVTGVDIEGRRRVSLRGRFVDTSTVAVEELHLHWPFFRDGASYLGLGAISLAWLCLRPRRQRAG